MDKMDTQIKFKVINVSKFLDKLHENDFIFIYGNFEKTTRYDTSKNYLFLRTKSGRKNVLTLKEKDNEHYEMFTRHSFELEIEDIDIMNRILEKIGFNKKYILEKYRMIWKLKNFEICLDELPFGVFCEVKGTSESIKEILEMFEVKKKDIYNCTYWEVFDKYIEMGLTEKSKNIEFKKNHIYQVASIL